MYTPEDELEALVLGNASREKTSEQKVREGMALERVVAERAKVRMLVTQNNNMAKEIAGVDGSSTADKGRTRDEVAKKVGLKSGRQFDRAKTVVKRCANEYSNCGSVNNLGTM